MPMDNVYLFIQFRWVGDVKTINTGKIKRNKIKTNTNHILSQSNWIWNKVLFARRENENNRQFNIRYLICEVFIFVFFLRTTIGLFKNLYRIMFRSSLLKVDRCINSLPNPWSISLSLVFLKWLNDTFFCCCCCSFSRSAFVGCWASEKEKKANIDYCNLLEKFRNHFSQKHWMFALTIVTWIRVIRVRAQNVPIATANNRTIRTNSAPWK